MEPVPSRASALRITLLAAVAVLAATDPAQAYIGPGAGFAVLGSFMVFFVAFLSAVVTLFTWPIRWAFPSCRGRR